MTQICVDKGTNMCQTYNGSYAMNRYIENLKSFLAEQTSNYTYDDAGSLLEMLYYYYTASNPVDNAVQNDPLLIAKV